MARHKDWKEIIPLVNRHLGTQYTDPKPALKHLMESCGWKIKPAIQVIHVGYETLEIKLGLYGWRKARDRAKRESVNWDGRLLKKINACYGKKFAVLKDAVLYCMKDCEYSIERARIALGVGHRRLKQRVAELEIEKPAVKQQPHSIKWDDVIKKINKDHSRDFIEIKPAMGFLIAEFDSNITHIAKYLKLSRTSVKKKLIELEFEWPGRFERREPRTPEYYSSNIRIDVEFNASAWIESGLKRSPCRHCSARFHEKKNLTCGDCPYVALYDASVTTGLPIRPEAVKNITNEKINRLFSDGFGGIMTHLNVSSTTTAVPVRL